MRIAEPPSLDSPWRGRSGDDLDGLLTAFFHSEMPSPWPTLDIPDSEPTLPFAGAPTPRRRPWRRWVALAASVALFLAGPWWGSNPFVGTEAQRGTGFRSVGDTADIRDLPRTRPHPHREEINLKPSGETEFKMFFDDNPLPRE